MKKLSNKMIAGILAASICLMTAACGNNVEEGDGDLATTNESSITEDNVVETAPSSGEADVTIINYPVVSYVDEVEKANGHYSQIILSDSLASKYPKLKAAIDDQNSFWKADCEESVASSAQWAVEMEASSPYCVASGADVVRVDDRMFSIWASYYYDQGGAHPNHYDDSINIDPATGRIYTISDVIADTDGFAQAVRDEMTKEYPDSIEGIDEYHYGDGDVFQEKYDEDTYTWFLTDEGLTLYFSPYEIDAYAAGDYEVTLSYDDYPNLVQDIYKQSEKQDLDSIIAEVEGDTITVEPSSGYDDEHDEEESGAITIANPTWDKYTSESVSDIDASIISLTMTKEDKTDWLDTDQWAADNGFDIARMPYSDGVYYYELYEFSDYGATELLIYNADETILLYDYDLSQICQGPDEESGYMTASEEYVRWAQIVEDTLYVSVAHYGYASEEPNNAYILAIDLTSNQLLWKSQPLVANSSNFQVFGDTIICGYGFTEEPDYIYLLNRYTGDIAQTIPVVSAPEQFEIRGTTLYVATYNTAYEFEIGQ